MSEQMLKLAKEKIEIAYADAIERKVEDPAVFVLDVRDKGALWLAERITDRSKIDAFILESDKRATMPVLTFAVSRKQATLLLGQLNPIAPTSLDNIQVPSTQFLAIGITGGSSSFSGIPKP